MMKIDDIDFEQYEKYKKYIEKINKEICKLCCIPKDRLNENKDERWTEYDCSRDASRY